MDLATSYLGLQLGSPLVAASSPLTLQFDSVRRLADLGIGAVVLGSLYEEACHAAGAGETDRAPSHRLQFQRAGYVEFVARVTAAVPVPVIASLNASGIGAWVHCAAELEAAGAAAIELDIGLLTVDPDASGDRVERDYADIVAAVRLHTRLPLAVKLPPTFAAPVATLRRLAAAGAGAAVLFRRSYTPDVDLARRRVVAQPPAAGPGDLAAILRWLLWLRGRTPLDLAAVGGIASGEDVLKAVAVGADVAMVCSVLLREGVTAAERLRREIVQGLERLGCAGIAGLRGTVGLPPLADPGLLERTLHLA